MRINKNKGFSLIEVLIALVIASIGLLGLAALQYDSLNAASNGFRSSLASVAILDAQQRVWKLRAEYDDCPSVRDELESEMNDWRSQWFSDEIENPLKDIDSSKAKIINLNNNSDDICKFGIKLEIPVRGETELEEIFHKFEIVGEMGEANEMP